MSAQNLLRGVDEAAAKWMARHGVTCVRIALSTIYLWFGAMKLLPGGGESEELAGRTIAVISFGIVPPSLSVPMLGVWECLIGASLASGKYLRLGLALLLAQIPGTFLPLALFPAECWARFGIPTLEGQYIIKNLVLICAAVVLGATMRGGGIIADPNAARQAKQREEQ